MSCNTTNYSKIVEFHTCLFTEAALTLNIIKFKFKLSNLGHTVFKTFS